jgi:hypothetical protein
MDTNYKVHLLQFILGTQDGTSKFASRTKRGKFLLRSTEEATDGVSWGISHGFFVPENGYMGYGPIRMQREVVALCSP